MQLKDQLHKLEYFTAIVEAGSLKKASEVVLIGQPQLTKVLQQLEDTLGTSLLLRSAKGVVLTKAGDQLYSYAKQILQKANEAEFSIKSEGRSIDGTLKIGTYDSIARYFFPDFLKYLRATVPGLKILLETGRSPDIFKKLKSKQLDIAIIVAQDNAPKSIDSQVIYTDSFGLYKSPSLSTDFVNNLIYFPYPLNETEKTMGNFQFTESIVCDSLETVKSLTEQEIGIGLLPHRVAKESVLAKKLTAHRHPKIKANSFDFHDISLYHIKNKDQLEKKFLIDEIKRFLLL